MMWGYSTVVFPWMTPRFRNSEPSIEVHQRQIWPDYDGNSSSVGDRYRGSEQTAPDSDNLRSATMSTFLRRLLLTINGVASGENPTLLLAQGLLELVQALPVVKHWMVCWNVSGFVRSLTLFRIRLIQ